MRITYYALRALPVGDEVRQPGDLVPEAVTWPYLNGYVTDGKIAPVLVATLPEETQQALLEWEEEVLGVTHEGIPASEEIVDTEVAPEPEPEEGEVEEIDKTAEGTEPDEVVPLDSTQKRVVKKPTKTGA